MGTVVTETQSTLREIEQRLDRFFRNPAEREDLPATTAMFDQVCGVLSLLGYEDPVAALRNVQESIGRFADAAIAPEPEEFSRIAQNLGAVGWSLTAEQVAKLDKASHVTPVYPYWHQAGFPERNPAPV